MILLIIDHLAAVIIFEHSFYIFDKRRYLQNQQESAPSFYVALDQYMSSSHAAAVREAVSTAVQAYEAAVRTLPTWRAKLSFKRFKKKAKEAKEEKEFLCSQAKAELIKTILETTLNHRLGMFHSHVVKAIPLTRLSSARP
jgi:hypothetical protein